MILWLVSLACAPRSEPATTSPSPAVVDTPTAPPTHPGRIALVIGNDDYEHMPGMGGNTIRDARAIHEFLQAQGFRSELRLDITTLEMTQAVIELRDSDPRNTLVLFYYAGHGASARGVNYLIGVDGSTRSSETIEESLSLNSVVAAMAVPGADATKLVIVDACRTAVEKQTFVEVTMAVPEGTHIVFGAGYGKTAGNGPERGHGVFTGELLRHLRGQTASFGDVMARTHDSVLAKTKRRQTPTEYKSAGANDAVYFKRADRGTGRVAVASIDAPRARPPQTKAIWTESFEQGQGKWNVEGGNWAFGRARFEGAPTPYGGRKLAGVALDGVYDPDRNSRLITPSFRVPPATELPRLRYWYWYDLANDYMRIQIRPEGDSWQNIGEIVTGSGRRWAQRIVDLSRFENRTVQIAFEFGSNRDGARASGAFVDEVSLEVASMQMRAREGFEEGFGDWSVEGGVWALGVPDYERGPAAFKGRNVAGTVLDGDFPADAHARLVSPMFRVPRATSAPRLRYAYWYDLADAHAMVQIKVDGEWRNLPSKQIARSGRDWRTDSVDLTPYAEQTVQIGFVLASRPNGATAAGLYIDEVALETGALARIRHDSFERGGVGWRLSGDWRIGVPRGERAPPAVRGNNVAGTGLDGHYEPSVNGRLESPEFRVPAARRNPRLRYYDWRDFVLGQGSVAISVAGGDWIEVHDHRVPERSVSGWSAHHIDLRPYERQTVRVAFAFGSGDSPSVGRGWYIDDVALRSSLRPHRSFRPPRK